jgi:hypothetical protein
MDSICPPLRAIGARQFPAQALKGLGFSEFVILHHLIPGPPGEQMRRIDSGGEDSGFTASGVTRLLLPMEKLRAW